MSEQTEKHLYIIRHGETEYNRMNIVQGSGVDTDLNEKGLMQAGKFYDSYKNFPFDKIYTSDLKRSRQSVQKFIEDGIPFEKLSGLNEINWGAIEGKPPSDEQKLMYKSVVDKWNAGALDEKIMNGESPNEMQQRQRKAFDYILKNKDEKNILICMHGRAMKSFICLLLDVSLTRMEDFNHTNLGLYLLKYDNSKFRMLKQNDIEHLK